MLRGRVASSLSLICGVLLMAGGGSLAGMQVSHLKCEYQLNPIGIDSASPRLSWILESATRGDRQGAYQVLAASDPRFLKPGKADLWDSGKIESDQSLHVVYAGNPLRSSQRIYWTVRVWDARGRASRFSRPAWFETALLDQADWKASWIEHRRGPVDDPFGEVPAPLLRKDFVLSKPVRSARAYVSGLGNYEFRINGKRVGDHLLDPGWTEYSRRVLYSTYDVTDLLQRGDNTAGAVLGNGWFNPLPLKFWGRINIREHLVVGEPRFIGQILVTYRDGSQEIILTDATWKSSESPILQNNLYLGETYDARKEKPGWDKPGFDDWDWQPVTLSPGGLGPLHAQQAPPIRVTRKIPAVKLTQPKPGVYIFDLGQNFSGCVQLRVNGPAGARVQLRYGELLYPDGTLNGMTAVCGQIKAGGPGYEYDGKGYPKTAWQQDTYVLKGAPEGESWAPRFTFHGFRYVEVKGFPGRPNLETITGLRLNSDVEQAGEFECSNELFNRIQRMVLWTHLGNLFSVQSDCPHREKFGYGGDIVAASEMGLLNFDMAQFYIKAVQDLTDSVRPNGGFTETAPFVGISDQGLGDKSGPVGWGTAHPLLQVQLHQYYGERRLLQEQYEHTRKWLRLLRANAKEGILDNGISDHESLAPKPRALTGTGFFYMNALLAAQIARVLGQEADAVEAESLAASIKEAFNKRFLDPKSGRYGTGTQASQAFALHLGLVPEQHREKALDTLVWNIVSENNGHLTTGIFGTKYMLNALTDLGRADTAYQVVKQRSFPGWGHMLENGATTLWEHWAFSDNTYSHNHPMFGSVSEWFYKGVGGIAPAPDAIGFDRIIIRPPTLPELTWARARYRSIRGPVATAWQKSEKEFRMRVTVPVGATAQVWVPARSVDAVTEGRKPWSAVEGLTFERIQGPYAVFRCGSGSYDFRSR
jgi:alpha-L-rhamnosidase